MEGGEASAGLEAAQAPGSRGAMGWLGGGSLPQEQAGLVGADCAYTFPTRPAHAALFSGLSHPLGSAQSARRQLLLQSCHPAENLFRRLPGAEVPFLGPLSPVPAAGLKPVWGWTRCSPVRLRSSPSHFLGKSCCLDMRAEKFRGCRSALTRGRGLRETQERELGPPGAGCGLLGTMIKDLRARSPGSEHQVEILTPPPLRDLCGLGYVTERLSACFLIYSTEIIVLALCLTGLMLN